MWFLEALKAAYGLGDGPLGWQLCLLDFLIADLHGSQSHFDENFIIWFTNSMSDSFCVAVLGTTHTDDNAMTGGPSFLDTTHDCFVKRFGKVSRVKLPFVHCGLAYANEGDPARILSADDDSTRATTSRRQPSDW